MKNIEFYTTPEGEITLRAEGEAEHTLDQFTACLILSGMQIEITFSNT
ncbi:MAG: hypothetical protein KBG19_00435 [Bacteroidales bacterium]|nr:hypothetical protein [Bacteroidales bacterium]